ncbi:MAG TPA: patatin family protein [Clostridia bacterium]|nr:patatin family protein [Clostridia bacterium]
MKLGLVLEGGGSRTYFTCGVLDCFLEEGTYADYVIGTSAGIANGVSYVSRQKGRNLEIATRFLNDKRYMGFKHLVNPNNKSYYNIKFVYEEIPNKHIPFDFKEFEKFEGDVVSVVTNVKTGQAEYLKMPRDDKSFVHLVASCALPIMFPLIEIDGMKYMDGGICDPIAVDEALRNDCDKVIVVLTREKGYVKEEEKALKLCAKLYRKHPEFSKALLDRTRVYNEKLKRVWELEEEGRVFVIGPKDVSGCKRTERNLDVINSLYNQGMDVAREAMPKLKEYLKLHIEKEKA